MFYMELLWENALNEQCKNTYEQGCMHGVAQLNCENGIRQAQKFVTCESFTRFSNYLPVAYAKLCCNVCSNGIRKFKQENICPPAAHAPVSELLGPALSSNNQRAILFESKATEMLDLTFDRCCDKYRIMPERQQRKVSQFFVNKETQFVDRCQTGSVCQHLCVDSGEAEVQCLCNEGFDLAENGRNCVDRDECAANLCPPDHRCENTFGSYECIALPIKRDNAVEEENESSSDPELAGMTKIYSTDNENSTKSLNQPRDSETKNVVPSQSDVQSDVLKCAGGGTFDLNVCQNSKSTQGSLQMSLI